MGTERAAAVSWMWRQMAWEQVLCRLRRNAGIDPGTGPRPDLDSREAA